MKNPFKSLSNLFSSNEKKKPLTIVELRDLKIRTEKIEKAIKSRAHISEINQRYNKMKDRNRKNFLKKARKTPLSRI
ncbi:hypothetical protein [uncultured Prochlorococcus sp.]|uniref:hypothetical protein n=1 Tax=uncultured Prochlorococcus sp. TaxID=159733 RepID=UPI000473EDC6|nr:hypothetical protein [uncultured Prochlorococcus sp.]